MQNLNSLDLEIKPGVCSLDRICVDQRRAFATKAAQAELGRFYISPEHADFVDRAPDEIKRLRAAAIWSRP